MALTCHASEIKDIVVVVISISVQKEQKLGYLEVIDCTVNGNSPVLISVHGALVETLTSLSPGFILLLSGLKTDPKDEKEKNRVSHLRLSTFNFACTASIKILTFDELQVVHRHNDAENLTILAQQVKDKLLAQLRCCRRQLNEIQCPGELSTVEVFVISSEAFSSRSSGTLLQRKRRRHELERNAYATLSDGKSRIVMVDCRKFITDLKAVQMSGDLVKITNVLSCIDETGEVTLKPTSKTVILPAQSDEVKIAARAQNRNPSQNESSVAIKQHEIVVSRLEAVFIDELGQELHSLHFVSPVRFMHAIIEANPSPRYRDATLTLEGSRVVKADAYAMQSLCASVEARQVLTNETTRRHVLDLVRGLMTEGTKLKWSLHEDFVKGLQVSNL